MVLYFMQVMKLSVDVSHNGELKNFVIYDFKTASNSYLYLIYLFFVFV